MKMAQCSSNGQKTLWEKEKLLVTSNFSFSHSVFKRLVLQTGKNQGLFGKGLMKKKVVPTLQQEVKVKVDIVTSDDIKIYNTGKFPDFTARYIIKNQ